MRFVLFLSLACALFGQLQPGKLPASWMSAEWIVHEYNADLYILRQPGSSHYEKPFLYLLFGRDRALLMDTGAGKPGTAALVQPLLAARGSLPLTVVHLHGHSDHTAGDSELANLPNVRMVPPSIDALKATFGIAEWPGETGSIDLGGRVVHAVPIPGHDSVSIALHDVQTGILFTGDSLYPGRLYVRDLPAFRVSIDRLVNWTATRPVSHVLGTHIEQTRTPFLDYPRGTRHQPEEHVLELGRAHLLELQTALRQFTMDADIALRDFTFVPVKPRR